MNVGVGEDGPTGDPNLVQRVAVRVTNLPCIKSCSVVHYVEKWRGYSDVDVDVSIEKGPTDLCTARTHCRL